MDHKTAVSLVNASKPVTELLTEINNRVYEAAHAGLTSVKIDVEKYKYATVKAVKLKLHKAGLKTGGLGWFTLTIHFDPKDAEDG